MINNNLLTLDEAAKTTGISRKKLSAYVEALDVAKHRGEDRRFYLAPYDVQRIQTFRATGEKANPAFFGMIAYSDHPQPLSMPRDYKNYVKEAFGQDPTVYKCVKYLTQNGAAIPPVLYADRSMKKPIKSHPVLDKLDTPNEDESGVDYREAVLGYFLIAGNSFQLALRKGTNGPPDELWTLQPNRVEVIGAKTRGVVGYRYLDYPDNMNPIPKQNMAHIKFWNPDSPVYGMSPLQVGAIMVDQQTASRKWNLGLLQNWARLPGAWTTNTILSQNERQKLEARLNEKFAGARGAGKFPLLDGGFTWTQIGASPTEMDWLQSIIYNAANIANLYDMPPQLIGDTSSTTYNNMQEAKAASYTEAIFPMLDKFYAKLNTWLLPMYPDLKNAYLYYDKTTVEVVQNVIQQRLTASAQRGNTAYMQGVAMLDEARELQGLAPLPNGAGKVFRLGAVLVRADDMTKYAEQSLTTPAAPPSALPEPLSVPPATDNQTATPEKQEPPANGKQPKKPPVDEENDDDTNDSASSSDKPAGKPPVKPANKPKSSPFRSTKAIDLKTSADKAAYFRQMEAARSRWDEEATGRIADYFRSEHKAVAKALHEHDGTYDVDSTISNALQAQVAPLTKVLRGLYEDILEDIGQEVLDALQNGIKAAHSHEYKAFKLNIFSAATVARLLQFAAAKVKQICLTTRGLIQDALAEGVSNGESIPQLAKRLDAVYMDDIIPKRSTVVARTEVVSASNLSAMEAGRQMSDQTDIQLNKVWLATNDSRTRPAHVDADGQEVGMEEKFVVGGEELDCPGDPSGSARNIVQCRCTTYFSRVKADIETSRNSHLDTMERKASKDTFREFVGVL